MSCKCRVIYSCSHHLQLGGGGEGCWLCVSSCLTKPATEEENGVVRLLARCDHEDWHLTTLWPPSRCVRLSGWWWWWCALSDLWPYHSNHINACGVWRMFEKGKKTNGSVYCISFRGVISAKTYKYIEQLNHRIWATTTQFDPIYHGNIITSWKCTT